MEICQTQIVGNDISQPEVQDKDGYRQLLHEISLSVVSANDELVHPKPMEEIQTDLWQIRELGISSSSLGNDIAITVETQSLKEDN